MQRFFLMMFSLAILTFKIDAQPFSKYVNLFICTSGDHGQLDPSATVPCGMVKVGPDTDPVNHSGYDFEATKVSGFSHNRLAGTGCKGAGGNLRIFPIIGSIDSASMPIMKNMENATPGYYSITFENGIKAELTATSQTGYHRYTFPKSKNAYLRFDLKSSLADFIDAKYMVINNNEMTVTVSAKNVCDVGRYTVYYHVWSDVGFQNLTEKELVLHVPFATKQNQTVNIQVTASAISCDDAREEWLHETAKYSFDTVSQMASQQWEKILSKINVEGDETYKTLFYTHLYQLYLNPVITENRNKNFKATDGKIYQSQAYKHLDGWSMWDNYRNKFSLFTIITPEISKDIANSLVDLHKYGMAYWSGYNEPVPTVRTEHSIITLLDMYQRGITDFDLDLVYRKMVAEISNITANSPDTKLELSYDYWALAQIAKILKQDADYKFFIGKSQEYKTTWNKDFKEMDKLADVMHAHGLYEGTLWQYRWHVQYDIDGLIELFGGKEQYTEQLTYFFDNYLYNHGNQPDIHVPFMFNFSNKPWLTQKWVNEILTKETKQFYGTHNKWKEPYIGHIYKAEPKGFIPEMDNDDGTMSAWYVLSAMGMYPVLVGDPLFQISTPIFDKISIQLGNGKTFTIITKNFSNESFYIQSATLNGVEFNQTFITQEQIMNGGTLIIETATTPNEQWGISK